jgi:hypothetical protein
MSRADKERRTWAPDRKTALVDKLKATHPEIFPLVGHSYVHQPLCPSNKYCNCTCAVSLKLANGEIYS